MSVAREGADLQAAPQMSAAACLVHTARPDSDIRMLWPISRRVDVSAKHFPSVVVPGPTQVQLDQLATSSLSLFLSGKITSA